MVLNITILTTLILLFLIKKKYFSWLLFKVIAYLMILQQIFNNGKFLSIFIRNFNEINIDEGGSWSFAYSNKLNRIFIGSN